MLSVSCYTKNILCTFTICSKMRENVGVDFSFFFFQILLVCFQSLFLFFVTQSPFPLHQKNSFSVHQLLKKFRENVRVDFFFQILGCFQSLFLFFVTHPATFCFCYKQKHSSYVHQLLIKFSVHTMLFSVSVTPTTFFTNFFSVKTQYDN